jgi:hypothetical protein
MNRVTTRAICNNTSIMRTINRVFPTMVNVVRSKMNRFINNDFKSLNFQHQRRFTNNPRTINYLPSVFPEMRLNTERSTIKNTIDYLPSVFPEMRFSTIRQSSLTKKSMVPVFIPTPDKLSVLKNTSEMIETNIFNLKIKKKLTEQYELKEIDSFLEKEIKSLEKKLQEVSEEIRSEMDSFLKKEIKSLEKKSREVSEEIEDEGHRLYENSEVFGQIFAVIMWPMIITGIIYLLYLVFG